MSDGLRHHLVGALPEPAILFAADGHVLETNAESLAWFGEGVASARTPAQALGSSRLAAAVTEAHEMGRPVEVETEVDGREVLARAAPAGDEVLLLLFDQTERRRVEAIRRDFVANASHEMKTPVAGIQALAEALETVATRSPERAKALAGRLAEEAERLGKLVHDLLSLRRLEEGGEFAQARVDLAEIVREEIARSRRAAARRRVDVNAHVPDHAVVVGEERDLRLIAANLLDNAIGYNRPGGSVDVRLERQDGSYRLAITDTGIGIPREDLDRIFERFYRVDAVRSRASGGTGLGLSIVRHAADRHGGRVHVESILGEGSTFSVTIPVEPAR